MFEHKEVCEGCVSLRAIMLYEQFEDTSDNYCMQVFHVSSANVIIGIPTLCNL